MRLHDPTTADELDDWMQAASEVERVRGGQLAALIGIAVLVVFLSYVL